MSYRCQRSPQERRTRSELAQLLTEDFFLPGSLVDKARSCGKPNCRCQRGQLHRSLYLAVRHQGRRTLLYIPKALEETVRQGLDHGRRLYHSLDALGQQELERLLQHKQTLFQQRRARPQSQPTG